MKESIHPVYEVNVIRCSTCGATFEAGSTKKEIVVDSCNNCHPFYTGKQKFASSKGRAERFKKMVAQKQEVKQETKKVVGKKSEEKITDLSKLKDLK